VLAVPVEQPPAEEERRPLVALAKGLRPGDSIHENAGRGHDVLDFTDRLKRLAQTIEVIWFVEPFVLVPDGSIDRDGELDGRPHQWSWRYSRASRYSSRRSSNQTRSSGLSWSSASSRAPRSV